MHFNPKTVLTLMYAWKEKVFKVLKVYTICSGNFILLYLHKNKCKNILTDFNECVRNGIFQVK